MEKHKDEWFKKKTFTYVLGKAICQYKKEESLFDSADGEISRCFRHISLYPCEFGEECKIILNEKFDSLKPLCDKLQELYYAEDDNIMNKVYAAKLLILVSKPNYDERKKLINGIEKQLETAEVKKQLIETDSKKQYDILMDQMRKHLPEGQTIIDSLDISAISLNYDKVSKLVKNVIDMGAKGNK